MSKLSKIIGECPLSGTENGKIEIAIVEEPYGKNTPSIVSIGIFLNKENSEPDWKVHIPKENIDDVVTALQKAKEQL